jgi:multiple sugar transport system permease protein
MATVAQTAQARPVKRRGLSRHAKEQITAWAFIAPFVISLSVFTVGALIYALVVSFTDLKLYNTPKFVGIDNYQRALSDPIFHKALGNSMLFSVIVVFAQTWLALLMAVVLNAKLRALRFFRTAWYTPAVTSSVVISLIFFWLYFKQGFLNYILVTLFGWAGFQPIAWLDSTTWALPAIMAMNTFTTAPTFMLMFLAALQDVPRDVYEAAAIDGATGPRVFFKITLPLLRPIIFLVVVLGTIGTLQVFDQIAVMTTGGPLDSTLTAGYLIWRSAFRDSLTDGLSYASAMAFILFVVILVFVIIQRRFLERGGEV